MAKSRKRNPGLFRTRKEAILAAISQAERDPDIRGSYFVVGGNRRWGIVGRRPNGPFWGPIGVENADKYRRWYA